MLEIIPCFALHNFSAEGKTGGEGEGRGGGGEGEGRGGGGEGEGGGGEGEGGGGREEQCECRVDGYRK